MGFAGTWTFTHAWSGQPPYSFPVTINADGTLTATGFVGTWTELGSSNQLGLAIVASDGTSWTAYTGNVAGSAMGGAMTGAGTGGTNPQQGFWSAVQVPQ